MSQKPHPKAQKERKFATVGMLIFLSTQEWKRLIFAFTAMGISAISTAGYAYLLGPVIRSLFLGSEASPAFELSDLLKWSKKLGSADPMFIGIAIVLLAIIKGAAYFAQTLLAGEANQRILHNLRARLYKGLLQINPLSREARAKGEISARFTVDLEAVQEALGQGLFAFVRNTLQIIVLAALSLLLDPFLGLIGLIALPPVGILIVKLGKRLKKKRAEVHQNYGQLAETIEETASGLTVIQSFGAEELMTERFQEKSRRIAKSTVRAIAARAISSPINEILGTSALAVTLFYAQARISQGAISPEGFISFFSALFLMYQPIKELGQAQHAVQAGLAALDRLAIFHPEVTGAMLSRKARPQIDFEELSLNRVSAGYSDAEDVLKELNMQIIAKSKIAVIGRSGAGKSTLLNTLLGFVPIRKGSVALNGVDVPSETLRQLGLFALVTQEPFLFDDTIKMNVLCGRPGSSMSEVQKACETAGVTSFSDRLQSRLDYYVGPEGKNLSTGERQRVCLARALLSNSPVLLLDEVTASLDGETEHEIIQRLDKYLLDRTVIIVTHRESTAKWADRVMLLESKKIIDAPRP